MYPIRIISQLRPILQGFRKSRGLTQAELAARLGVSQQTYARLEANPGRVSVERLHAVLQALDVEIQLSPQGDDDYHGGPVAVRQPREPW
ncbi:helix-turn-helix domain-containing protein [Cupriavidus campinensis]